MVEHWTANPKVQGSKLAAGKDNFFYKILSILLLFYDFQPFEEEN